MIYTQEDLIAMQDFVSPYGGQILTKTGNSKSIAVIFNKKQYVFANPVHLTSWVEANFTAKPQTSLHTTTKKGALK